MPEFKNIEIVDYWDADLCAIGLKKHDRLIYISTYSSLDQVETHYSYNIETFDENNIDNIKTLEQGDGLSENELWDKIKITFKV